MIAKISKESDEYKWVISHIKIVGLYDIEKYSFIGESIIKKLEESESMLNPFDYVLIDAPAGTIINPDVLAFKKKIKKCLGELRSEIS